MFTEMKIDAQAAQARAAELASGLKANTGKSDLLGYGLGVVSRRLQRDPARYTDYGPYWWALKALLRDGGYSVGDSDDTLVRSGYAGDSPVLTLVMADMMRDTLLESTSVGTREFWISDDAAGSPYVLFDVDMEAAAAARRKAG